MQMPLSHDAQIDHKHLLLTGLSLSLLHYNKNRHINTAIVQRQELHVEPGLMVQRVREDEPQCLFDFTVQVPRKVIQLLSSGALWHSV